MHHGSPSFQLIDSSDTNVNGTNVVIPWSTQEHIDARYFTHSTLANTSRVTFTHAGVYKLTVSLGLSGAVARFNGILTLRKNGTTTLSGAGKSGYIRNANGHTQSSLHLTTIVALEAGDYVEAICNREAQAGTVTMVSSQSLFNGFTLSLKRA